MSYPNDTPRGSYGPLGPMPPVAPLLGLAGAAPVIPKLYWDVYSDEQRLKALWQCLNLMADRVNQLGYYYIPDFQGTWSSTKEYPPLSVVEAPSGIEGVTAGDSYTAIDYVPVGTPLTDETHWARTGNYNQQVQDAVDTVTQRMDQLQESFDALQGSVSTNTSDISDLKARATELETTRAILIGDSYLRTYTDNNGWGDSFEDATGWDCTRYKSGGAGWVALGTSDTEAGLNFGGMLSKARDAMSADERADVDYIVVQGLINDLQTNQSYDAITGAYQSFLDNARSWFPNAQICVTCALCSKEYMGSEVGMNVIKYMNRTSHSGVRFGSYSNFWFHGLVDNYGRGDDIHPNNSGYPYLGRLIARNAMGNGVIYNDFTMTSSQIASLITSQVSGFANWGAVQSAGMYVKGGVARVTLQIGITDASQLPSAKNVYATLPIVASHDNVIAVGDAVLVTGDYIYFPRGATVTSYDTEVGGNIRVNVYPNAVVNGEPYTYKTGDYIMYNFQYVMGQ